MNVHSIVEEKMLLGKRHLSTTWQDGDDRAEGRERAEEALM